MANSDYNFVVRGKDFTIITNSVVKILKQAVGKIPQNGIRKFGDDAYILQSNSAHDILDCVRNGGWAHSTSALVKKGMKVYVLPSNPVENLYGNGAVGVEFTAIEDMHQDVNNEFTWSSEA